MRMPPVAARAYTYKVTEGPAARAVSLETFKLHIKRSSAIEDTLLKTYLDAAIDTAERITKRVFITRAFETFRDYFPVAVQNEGYYSDGFLPSIGSPFGGDSGNFGFELRQSPLQSITSIEYRVLGSFETLAPTVYYNTVEEDYSEVLTLEGQQWPTNADRRLQSIKITFIAGYGATEADVPSDIKDAILMHATGMWSDRGDCCDADSSVPAASKGTYLRNRIESL